MIINISWLYDFFFFTSQKASAYFFFHFMSPFAFSLQAKQNTACTPAEHGAERIERWSRSNIRGLCILISVFSGWRRNTKQKKIDEVSFWTYFFLARTQHATATVYTEWHRESEFLLRVLRLEIYVGDLNSDSVTGSCY